METVARNGIFYNLGILLVDGQSDLLTEKLYRPFVVFCSFSQ